VGVWIGLDWIELLLLCEPRFSSVYLLIVPGTGIIFFFDKPIAARLF
jgi:hypothetical protein